MPWVPTIPEDQARGPLADVYRKAWGRAGNVPNITKVQSLPGVAKDVVRKVIDVRYRT